MVSADELPQGVGKVWVGQWDSRHGIFITPGNISSTKRTRALGAAGGRSEVKGAIQGRKAKRFPRWA